jgi:hypothetical protein
MFFRYQNEDNKEKNKRQSIKNKLHNKEQSKDTEENKTNLALFKCMDENLAKLHEAAMLADVSNLQEEIKNLSASKLEMSEHYEDEIDVAFVIDATCSVVNKNWGGLEGNDRKIREAYDEFLQMNAEKPIRVTTNVYKNGKSDFQAVRCPIKSANVLNYHNESGPIFYDASCETIEKCGKKKGNQIANHPLLLF